MLAAQHGNVLANHRFSCHKSGSGKVNSIAIKQDLVSSELWKDKRLKEYRRINDLCYKFDEKWHNYKEYQSLCISCLTC